MSPPIDAHALLDYLRTFRNRIAHHEPIFERHLAAGHDSILLATDWISAETQHYQAGRWNLPRARRPMSQEQRAKLSSAQNAYVANDPRRAEHRRKLAAAQKARRMTLLENEVAAIVEMRKTGRTFSYIAEETASVVR